ncbi:MAG: GDP-mannose 4,6-dehydratase, partial [Candidatus Omnitrophota bacterium]|nr:GDP-mannose 4,6-dehydratase [Candidatus Omnitrophota bacterium]
RILKDQPLLIYGTGKQTRTFCYVSDAIAGFLKVLLHGRGGEAYNIGNPTPEISMLELARTLETVLGRSLNIEIVDHPSSYPADEPQRRCPDISKAVQEVGYQPAIALEEGLKRFMDWARAHYTKDGSASRAVDRPARARV